MRRAAVSASADVPEREPIMTASTDGSPELRRTAALAVGFASPADPRQATPRSSRRCAQRRRAESAPPGVCSLKVIEQQGPQPPYWKRPAKRNFGGANPSYDSWHILFDFARSRPPAEPTSGKLDPSLDALERAHFFGLGEPGDLYALYMSRGLVSRAKQFQVETRMRLPRLRTVENRGFIGAHALSGVSMSAHGMR